MKIMLTAFFFAILTFIVTLHGMMKCSIGVRIGSWFTAMGSLGLSAPDSDVKGALTLILVGISILFSHKGAH